MAYKRQNFADGQILTAENLNKMEEALEAAAPGGYGWGETTAAKIPDDDADMALATGLYRTTTDTVNTPDNCNLVFALAVSSGFVYQTAYCTDGTVSMRINDHDNWSEWERISGSQESAETIARLGNVYLHASAWEGSGSLHSQVVEIEGVTENSQVDLTPSVEQLAIFYDKSIAFVAENEDGVVTVYAIGQKPENDYTIQVTITEVYV